MDDNGYLRRANDALVMAEKAKDPAIRRGFLEIALEWQRLAKHVMKVSDLQKLATQNPSLPTGAEKADHRGRPN